MSDYDDGYPVDPFDPGARFTESEDRAGRGRDRQASVGAPSTLSYAEEREQYRSEWEREAREADAAAGWMRSAEESPSSGPTQEPARRASGLKGLLDSVTVFGDRGETGNMSRGEKVANRLVGKMLGEEQPRPAGTAQESGRTASGRNAVRTVDPETGGRTVSASDASDRRAAAGQEVHSVAAFLSNVEQRRSEGEKTPAQVPMRKVLATFKDSPINQTRIQVLAAAATARHLEGPDSENAHKLSLLVEDNAARVQALREEERHLAGIEHETNGTPQEEIDAEEQTRNEREAAEDKQVFNAASAVSLGYVEAQGLPSYEQLAALSEAQLGQVPNEVEPAPAPEAGGEGRSSRSGMQDVLNAAGKGLAQAVGPVVGDDDVAPNLSPVNLAQFNEELASLAAGMAPAMRAAMSSHPRSVKELLNADQKVDEKSTFFENDQDLDRELEEQQEQQQESEREV